MSRRWSELDALAVLDAADLLDVMGEHALAGKLRGLVASRFPEVFQPHPVPEK